MAAPPTITFFHPNTGHLRFVLSMKEFSDGYTNSLTQTGTPGFTHYHQVLWHHGTVNDLQVTLSLMVEEDFSKTPTELIDTVAKFYSMCLPKKTGTSIISTTKIEIGVGTSHWFVRTGVMKDVKVKWQEPWDRDTGMPMKAEVSLTLAAHYNIDSQDVVNSHLLPVAPWKFNKNWGI
jgi:hypothetical protein